MNIRTIKSTYECALKNERHDRVSETRYWCDQYRLLAKLAIDELEKRAGDVEGLTDKQKLVLIKHAPNWTILQLIEEVETTLRINNA